MTGNKSVKEELRILGYIKVQAVMDKGWTEMWNKTAHRVANPAFDLTQQPLRDLVISEIREAL